MIQEILYILSNFQEKAAAKREYESYESFGTNSQEDEDLSREGTTVEEDDTNTEETGTEEDMEVIRQSAPAADEATDPPKAKKALMTPTPTPTPTPPATPQPEIKRPESPASSSVKDGKDAGTV